MSVKSIGAADSDIAEYYEQFAQDNYYRLNGEPPGRWHGSLTKGLDMLGYVKPGQLARMFMGCHPLTAFPLSDNAGTAHKAGWDLTFSAPKSVSVLWGIDNESVSNEITNAHNEAVSYALSYLERNAFKSRDRQASGHNATAILAAVFQHGTSREEDPQLHSHAVIANLGMRADDSFCAIDFDSRWKMAAGAIYRVHLADTLQTKGYKIERDGKSFKIIGIDDKLCKAFSKRRQQIDDHLDNLGLSSSKAASIAALQTRKKKLDVDRGSLKDKWREEATIQGVNFDGLSKIREINQYVQSAANEQALFTVKVSESSLIDVDNTLKQLTASQSVFTRQQLEAAILTEAQGVMAPAAVEKNIQAIILERLTLQAPLGLIQLQTKSNDRRSRNDTYFTTHQILRIEQEIIDDAQARISEKQHIVSAHCTLKQNPKLSEEQRQALIHITESAGAVTLVHGLAGTGKSMLMKAAKQAWDGAGLNVKGVALAGKAADSLEIGSSIKSQTLHSLLAELKSEYVKLTANDVLVIDEAGMIGSRQLKEVLDHVHAANAKVVMIGDSLQLQPIEAGGLFRTIGEVIGHASLTEIRRQEKDEDRKMIFDLLANKSSAVIKSLSNRGRLNIEPISIVYNKMIDHWLSTRDRLYPQQDLMLAGSKLDVLRLNLLAHHHLKATHEICMPILVSTDQGEREFCAGEKVIFTRNSKVLNVKNGQSGILESWKINSFGNIELNVVMDHGERVLVDLNKYQQVDYGYAMSVHKAQGQTVDNVTILMSETMTDREWTYVATSRHRKECHVFVAEEICEESLRKIVRSHQKLVTNDFEMPTNQAFQKSYSPLMEDQLVEFEIEV